MSNRFFAPGEQRAAKVRDLFDGIARRYDLLNDLQSFGLHRYWKRRLLKMARVRPGARALDVCCGTGDLALAMARQGAEVTGIDFSQPMLDVAVRRSNSLKTDAAALPCPAPRFIQGDAQSLPFADGLFEIVTVGYGLRNLASWETGLGEMQRVARSGGRVLVLEFGKPEFRLWRNIYFGYLRFIVPCLGRVFAGSSDSYSYILESLKHYPAQQGVAAGMRTLGFQNVRVVNLLGGVMSINYGEKQ